MPDIRYTPEIRNVCLTGFLGQEPFPAIHQFIPSFFVLFDTWYASVKNLKAMRKKEWHFLTRLKNNHLVNPDKKGNVPLETVNIPPKRLVVHFKAYGLYTLN